MGYVRTNVAGLWAWPQTAAASKTPDRECSSVCGVLVRVHAESYPQSGGNRERASSRQLTTPVILQEPAGHAGSCSIRVVEGTRVARM